MENQSPFAASPAMEPRPTLELLAPAGDWDSLQAALEAGAGAVYFGLTSLNARRRARNFQQEEFGPAVELAHAHSARAYLTLNIDLAERELGQAVRILELARQCGADAVLVRDPALLAFKAEYPELEFHFSTQTCMANTADVTAAGKLGAARVVLAREMSLDEIAAASRVRGVQTEVFVQGALCFCISGRCLLSSWVGGRSGNRGACTSPCRVPWTVADREAGTPLSMRDLAAVGRIEELRRAGVTGLKIEGRLKNPAWVRRAVGLYHRALAGDTAAQEQLTREHFLEEAAALGDYTGRQMTCGYLEGQRDDLTAPAGRTGRASSTQPGTCRAIGTQLGTEQGTGGASGTQGGTGFASDDLARDTPLGPGDDSADEATDELTYDLAILVTDSGVVCRCECLGRTSEWTIPKTVIRRAHKARTVESVFERLRGVPIQGCVLTGETMNEPEFLLVPRAVNALAERISAAIRHARKTPGETIRVKLPETVQALLEKGEPSPANDQILGAEPNRVRIEAVSLAAFAARVRPEAFVVEGASPQSLPRVVEDARGATVIVALPQVFFEGDLPRLQRLVEACKSARLGVEVNSWGGWQLARPAGVRMESGPGLPVLNSLAAKVLRDQGMRSVTLSVEADRRQLEEITAHCPSPCSLVVFARPPLLVSRARLAESYLNEVFADRRDAQIVPRLERGLWVFRPVEPMDLRGKRNERIRVRNLVVDLVGSPDPIGDWYASPLPEDPAFRFNYDRSLA